MRQMVILKYTSLSRTLTKPTMDTLPWDGTHQLWTPYLGMEHTMDNLSWDGTHQLATTVWTPYLRKRSYLGMEHAVAGVAGQGGEARHPGTVDGAGQHRLPKHKWQAQVVITSKSPSGLPINMLKPFWKQLPIRGDPLTKSWNFFIQRSKKFRLRHSTRYNLNFLIFTGNYVYFGLKAWLFTSSKAMSFLLTDYPFKSYQRLW